MRRPATLLAIALVASMSSLAAQKEETIKTGPATPPTVKASENTNIDVADGLPVNTTGALDANDSSYNRQAGDCGGLSAIGTNVFYDTVTLTNTSGIFAALDVTTSDVGQPSQCTSGDTYLSVYSPTFNAVSPLTNCVTSNDDGGPGVCSAVSFDLPVGQTAILVLASYGNGAMFDYQVNISSPACSNGIVYDDGSFEGGLRGPMGTQTVEISQRFDLPLIGDAGGEVQRICACLSHTVSAVSDFPVNFVVRRPNASGTLPGSRIRTESISAMSIPEFPSCRFVSVDLAGVTFDTDVLFVGVEWSQNNFPELLIAEDTNGPTTQPSFVTTNQGGSWSAATTLDPDYRNLGVRATIDEPFTALSSSAGLLLPGYSIDLSDPGGATTFVNVRNTTDSTLELDATYYGDEVVASPLRVDGITVPAQKVSVTNIRNDTTDLDPDGDDVASGLMLVNRSDTHDAMGLTGDFFNVDFGADFASGDRMFEIPGDFCDNLEIRFLDFGSGTQLKIVVDQPQGDIAPSFSYRVYSEPGVFLSEGKYFTNKHINLVDIATFAGATRFGTLVFDFSRSGGGLVVGKYSAFGRFSVEFHGACLP